MQTLLPWLRGELVPDSRMGRGLLRVLGGLGAILARYQRWRVGRYRRGAQRGYRAPCPVISVGNLTVGGTGKTPMVIRLARWIQASGGRVAVVSRGYRQKSRAKVTVVSDHERVWLAPPEAADEAALLARTLPGVAVLTGSDRAALIRHATQRLGSDWILMDDGFHRLDVERDLDLVLLDARRPFGNGFLLPGGILRESPEALERCDGVILTRAEDAEVARRAREMLRERFFKGRILAATHRPTGWIDARQPGAVAPLAGLTGSVLAFCGLAAPEGFRRTLEGLGVRVAGFHPFPDHHAFTLGEVRGLVDQARRLGAGVLVCTEKDLVKLDRVVGEVALPVLALRVEMAMLENGEAWLEAWLKELAGSRGQGPLVGFGAKL